MKMSALVLLASFCLCSAVQAQTCRATPINFNSHIAETEGELTIKAGTSCALSVSGLEGAINETRITQKPKVGIAGVRGNSAVYVAKAGYSGSDEFAYQHVGTDQYGGPMRVSVRRKITVVP